MDLKSLRSKYPVFEYDSFKYDFDESGLNIEFLFKSEEIEFRPILKFKEAKPNLEKHIIENFIFHIGLVEMLSYWKAFCSPEIKVSAGCLTAVQVNWWHGLLIHGMGQYFFENNIDFRSENFVSIFSTRPEKVSQLFKSSKNKVIVPLGGGKDSIVTLETLKSDFEAAAFALNPTPAVDQVIKNASIKSTIVVERKLDPKLLELNNQGYLNGHTPFSALIAFLSTFAAALFGYGNIALSNERSSDEANTHFLDSEVNHQYSKTYEFEKMFREYNKQFLSDINYFSYLRPLYEIQIVKIFSEMEKYFQIVKSCNIGQKTNTWCCNCPKCLSTFILMYPFIEREKLVNIFDEDLFENGSLKAMLDNLIDDDKVKPFECVGTREELKIALSMSIQKTSNLPVLLAYAKEKLSDYHPNMQVLHDWSDKNFLTEEFMKILKSYIHE